MSEPLPPFGYPEGYRDPEYDGTVAGFRDVVLPARVEALERSLNEALAGILPPGMRFEWATSDDVTAPALRSA